MNRHDWVSIQSYVKSAIGFTLLLLGFVALSIVVDRQVSDTPILVTAISTEVLVTAFLLFVGTGSWVVVLRASRGARDAPDLFELFNASQSEAAVGDSRHRVIRNPLRRWIATKLLGHDFLVGDDVRVLPWEDIKLTLDENGCLNGLPFMPEMKAACGSTGTVFRCVDRVLDYRRTNQMRRLEHGVLLSRQTCDGSYHGGCQAACRPIWHTSWLTKDLRPSRRANAPESGGRKVPALARSGSHVCQLTQMQAASTPQTDSVAVIALRSWAAGNVTAVACLVALTTRAFNAAQRLRQGTTFPHVEPANKLQRQAVDVEYRPGDIVKVRAGPEIRATLDKHSKHKGLWFDPDMLKHCGRKYRIKAEIRQLVDAVSGEMRTLKTPCYTLQGVDYSGEPLLFSPQHEPLMWRAIWLEPTANGSLPDQR